MPPPPTAVLVAVCVAVVWALAGCGGPTARDESGRVVVFGHSFVRGTPDAIRWVDRVATTLGRRVAVIGVDGAMSSETRAHVEAYAPRESDTVVIETGINDMRTGGLHGLRAYSDNLDAMLVHLDGRPRKTILVSDPPFLPATVGSMKLARGYTAATKAVGSRHGVTVVDLSPGWDLQRFVAADGVHPNDAGTRRIARLVEEGISQ